MPTDTYINMQRLYSLWLETVDFWLNICLIVFVNPYECSCLARSYRFNQLCIFLFEWKISRFNKTAKYFLEYPQNRLISAWLESVLSHTEKHASYRIIENVPMVFCPSGPTKLVLILYFLYLLILSAEYCLLYDYMLFVYWTVNCVWT